MLAIQFEYGKNVIPLELQEGLPFVFKIVWRQSELRFSVCAASVAHTFLFTGENTR